jgi:hypothetical protein
VVHLIIFASSFGLRESCGVKNDGNIMHCGDERFGKRTVAFCQMDIQSRKPPEPVRVSDKTGNDVALLEKRFHQVAPHETRTAGDQNSFLE